MNVKAILDHCKWGAGLAALAAIWTARTTVRHLRPARREPPATDSLTPEPFDGRTETLAAVIQAGKPRHFRGVAEAWPWLDQLKANPLIAAIGGRPVSVKVADLEATSFAESTETNRNMAFGEFLHQIFFKKDPDKRLYTFHGVADLVQQAGGLPEAPAGCRLDADATGLFIGMAGQITKLHYDWWHGWLTQTTGRKRVLLLPPGESRYLYCHSPFFGDLDRGLTRLPPDLETLAGDFPDTRLAKRFDILLEPGDMLYIPPFWWHEVYYLDDTISFGFRFKPGLLESAHASLFPLAMYQRRWNLARGRRTPGRQAA